MQTDKTTLVFRALSDPIRRAILERIAVKPAHVALLTKQFPVTRPAISKHLRVLKEAGLVRYTEAGKKRLYRMEPAPLRLADEWLEHYRRFWKESLQHLKEHLESTGSSQQKRAKRR